MHGGSSMTEPRITAHGKQLMLDGKHLADARDIEAAEVMAFVLSNHFLPCSVSDENMDKYMEFFAS